MFLYIPIYNSLVDIMMPEIAVGLFAQTPIATGTVVMVKFSTVMA